MPATRLSRRLCISVRYVYLSSINSAQGGHIFIIRANYKVILGTEGQKKSIQFEQVRKSSQRNRVSERRGALGD